MNLLANPFYLMPPLIVSGISLILLIIVLAHDYRATMASRIFSLLLLTMMVWGVVIFAMRASPDATHALRWDKAIPAIAIAMAVFYYHFSFLVTRAVTNRKSLTIAYILLAVTIGLSPTGFFITRMEVQPYGYAPIFEPATYAVFLTVYVLLIAALYNLIRGYRSATTYEEKNSRLFLTLAMAFPLLGGIFEAIPDIYPTAIFGNIMFCLFATIAVLRFQLLDIRLAIRRGLTYLLVGSIVAIPYIIMLLIAVYLLGGLESLPIWVRIVVIILLATTLPPLWMRAQGWIDRQTYRERYDYLRTLRKVGQKTYSIDNIDELCASLVILISRALYASGCYLLTSSSNGDFTIQSSSRQSDRVPQLRLSQQSSLIRHLERSNSILRSRDLDIIHKLRLISDREKESLKEIEAELYVPLRSQARLVGIIVLGKKLSRQPYSWEEESLLVTIASQIAVSLDNARLFQETKHAYEQLKSAQEYIVRSERLRALGEMASGAAHDFNNILAAILARAQLALDDVSEGSLKKSLQVIEQAALDGANTVRRLQDYARVRHEQAFEPIDLKQVVESTLPIIEHRRRELGEISGIDIAIFLELGKVNPIAGDAGELREVLTNIMLNAIEAMPKGGRITLSTRQEESWAIIAVSDTGIGMTEEIKSRLFEPFFTTKQRRGSGVGLSIAHSIVTRHGGTIEVESSPGKGSTFFVKLPITTRVKASTILPDQPPPTKAITILIVDDDERVSDSLQLVFTSLGHKVTATTTSREALAAFRQADYDLVVTDLGMPDMSGYEIAKAVKEIKPGTPVLLITGWSAQLGSEKVHEPGIDGIIAKPFTKNTLAVELARLLKLKERQRQEGGSTDARA